MATILEYARSKLTRLRTQPTGAVVVDRTDEAIVITIDLGEAGREASRQQAIVGVVFLTCWLLLIWILTGASRYSLSASIARWFFCSVGTAMLLWSTYANLKDARDPFWSRLFVTRLGIVAQRQRRSGARASSSFCPRDRIGEITFSSTGYHSGRGDYSIAIYPRGAVRASGSFRCVCRDR